MSDTFTPAGRVNITPAELAASAAKIRPELLKVPFLALGPALKYFTLRTGIRHSETVGRLDGNFEVAPYDPYRVTRDNVDVKARTLFTHLGSVVAEFDPNSVYQSIYGSSITKGDALKNVPIVQQVLTLMAGKVGDNLRRHLFDAVRKDSGTTTADLFNGVDTVAAKEITAGNISTSKGNLYEFADVIDSTNAVDLIVDFCRSASDELLEAEDGGDSERQGLNLYVPRSIVYAYRDDYKATTGHSPIYDKFNQTVIEGFSNIRLVPFAGKSKSNLIELSTARNMLIGTDLTGDFEKVSVEKYHAFLLQFVMTLFFGFDFESIEADSLLVGKLKSASAPVPAPAPETPSTNPDNSDSNE